MVEISPWTRQAGILLSGLRKMIEKNTNYASDGKLVVIEGVEYPLLKTTEKMVFYMKEDEIKRVKIDKVESVV
jgi:hypothetical protein